MTDTVRLCLSFLSALNHTIAIAPLVRFYSEAVQAEEGGKGPSAYEFETAIKSITAFTVFWCCATRRGTGNIDSQYRAVMAGDSLTGMGPLARQRAGSGASKVDPILDAEALKMELAARLSDSEYGGIANLASFLASASALPLYTISTPPTRFLLLAAYHDTTEDPLNPGLIIRGKTGVAACFTADGWANETHLTIEHIAPRQATSGWDDDFYSQKETVGSNKLGNLVLAPGDANASLKLVPGTRRRCCTLRLASSLPRMPSPSSIALA